MVVVGLVPDLTSQAARLAALGAGAKVIGTYSYKLTKKEKKEIELYNPDIILLVGGTDGGNEEIILWNANIISHVNNNAPIIIAGNKVVAQNVVKIFNLSGKTTFVSDNVMPTIGKFNVDPVREMIQSIFVDRIIISKGFKRVNEYIDGNLIPTPVAVLDAVKLLSEGTNSVKGLGELVAIDIGGATTDVYSIATGLPTKEGTIMKGFPSPYHMRTVEGDLGLRSNAVSIIEQVGSDSILKSVGIKNINLETITRELSTKISKIPKSRAAKTIDLALAKSAAQLALRRHAGYITKISTPMGRMNVQYRKDLSGINSLISTGGIFAHCGNKGLKKILEEALSNYDDLLALTPQKPRFYIDTNYILYGMGLLFNYYPDKAMRILKRYLVPIN